MASKAKKKPDHSQLPIQYLFTGYYKKDKLVTEVKPLPNTLILAENPEDACYKNDVPLLLRTNEHGGVICRRARCEGHLLKEMLKN